jgi:sulfite exporter TauE/SafE
MNEIDLYAMFMLGILGTGHCIGMCGPLIFAFPARTAKFSPHVFYHLGRTLTYVAMGGMMGAVGVALAKIASATGSDPQAWIARIQIGLRLLAALFLIIFGLSRLGVLAEPGWLAAASPNKIPGFRKVLKSAALQTGQAEMFILGLMLGLLPCGLSYGAFARALPTGSIFNGALLVLAFAIGTIPGLLLLGTGASKIFQRYRKQSDILAGLLMLYMGVKLSVKAFTSIFA